MKLDSIIPPELALLESLQRGTDPLTRKNLQVMHENFVVPYSRWLKSQYTLLEAEMTADQITQAFGYAEKIATAGGDNRSMLGKGADVVGAGVKGAKDLAAKLVPQAVKDKFTKSLPPADAGPVEGFEQKATQAIAGIQDPKAKQSLMDKIKIGLQNPATQQLIMVGVSGIAGVIASTATAGIGGYAGAAAAGAITGSLLGAINAKMQGKSWADTGKAALKGAALGAAGGLIGKGVADAGSAAIDAVKGSNAPTGPAGAPGAQDDATGVDDAVQKNATDDWQKLAQKADGLALAASGNSSNPDGTASPAMAKYMQAQADSQAAYSKINPNDGYNAPDPSAPAGGDAAPTVRANLDQWRADNTASAGPIDGGTPHTTADGQVIPPGASQSGNTIYNNSDPADPNVMADIKAKQDYYKNDPAGQAEYAKIMAPDRISDGPSAPINANAGQQQVDLNNMVQNKIDTGAIPAPQGATPADTGTSAAPATGFKEVTPEGDVVGQLKALVGQGYQVQRSQTDPGSIAVFDKDGNPMQTLKVGGFNASRMSAAANGILLRSGHSPVPAINENVDYELTARMWALRNRVGKPYSKIHMTEEAIQRAFVLAASSQLNEGPMDWIKKKAGQAADFVKTKVGNVTNKITADKLQQAWTKAGSPTDSVEVGKIMAANGVPQDSVDQILKNMGVPNAPAAPAQAGADAGTPETPPTQAPTPEAPPAQAGGATPPAKAGGRDIPVDPSSVAPPDAKQGAGGAPTPPTQAQTGGTSTPPTNKEIAQGAIAKAQDSSKGGATIGGALGKAATDMTQGLRDPKTGELTGASAIGAAGTAAADAIGGIAGAIEKGAFAPAGTNVADQSYGQKTGTSAGGIGKIPQDVTIKDATGVPNRYTKKGKQWFDAEGKEVPPAMNTMLDRHAEMQAVGPKGTIPGAKPPVPAKPDATPPATVGETPPAPAKAEPMKIGGKTLDPKNPADKKIIDQVQAQQGAAQTPPAATPATPATAQQPGATPPAAKPGATPPATAQQAPAKPDPRDLNKDGTVDATEKSIARNQAKTGAQQPGAAPPAQTPTTAATPPAAKPGATPPAATTAPASQSPEDIRKAKQADAAKAAQAQMTAKPAPAATTPATEPAATAEPVPGETPAQTAAKTHTGGKVAGQVSQTPNAIRKRDARAVAAQANTTGNDVMGRMTKQLGAAPAGGPAQAEPAATPAATPDFSKTMTGYGKTTTNAPTGVPSVAKPAVPAATNATTEPAAVAPKAKRSVTGDVPVPDNFGKQPEMAGIDFSAVLLRKMKQVV